MGETKHALPWRLRVDFKSTTRPTTVSGTKILVVEGESRQEAEDAARKHLAAEGLIATAFEDLDHKTPDDPPV